MTEYKNVSELIENIDNLPIPGRLYIEKSNFLNVSEAFFLVISSKEAKDQNMVEIENDLIPENLIDKNVKSFFDTATFEDILIIQKENKESSSLADFIKAIEYYRENDTFME
ncbi:DUF7716 domain-containing protein [Zobellia laminariae]|uniref:DUF7716 domain-containing protein n=1 Tax=Zobellia laminariae TaxID=248906 RepID=UPI003EF63497